MPAIPRSLYFRSSPIGFQFRWLACLRFVIPTAYRHYGAVGNPGPSVRRLETRLHPLIQNAALRRDTVPIQVAGTDYERFQTRPYHKLTGVFAFEPMIRNAATITATP